MSPGEAPARERAAQITRELTRLLRTGKILPGSITQRHTFCGRAGCACQADPPRPHGPYWQWTRKVKGRTVTRRLSQEQIERYGPWIANDHRLRELITALETLSIEHLEAEQHRD